VGSELWKTGIGVASGAPWGTHGCVFYETKQDLLDTVIPFLKTGLEERELCLWVVSEPLTEEDAIGALREAVPDLDRYLGDQSIELVPYEGWYLEGGTLDLTRLVSRLHDKLETALAKGYAGLRATGDTGWLEKDQRKSFCDYEQELNDSIGTHRMSVLCTYPMARSSIDVFLGATFTHRVCATLRHGHWEIIKTPELREASAEIKKLNQHLEQKVVDRTQVLFTANEELRREIDERKRLEDELRKQKEVLQQIFDHIPVMINFMGAGNRIQLVNREWERTLGWTLEEIQKDNLDIVAKCYPNPNDHQQVVHFISNSNAEWKEFKTRVRDGRVIDTCWVMNHLSDGTSIGIGQDITERKQWEDRLRTTTEQLRALSASIQAGREAERTHMARTVHDELGSALTTLKWDLEGLDKTFTKPLDPQSATVIRKKIATMMELADSTIHTVRRVAWDLRPSILDDLGLAEAIEWQARQFETRTGIVCQRGSYLDEISFNEEQSTAIFRIFQEALTNILRHADATRVDITMTQEAGEFVLAIGDNGRGITGIEKSGLGILGMQERARLVGGKIEIHGLEGAGTTIAVRVPVVLPNSDPSNKHSKDQ
jgi:PAS domain S-box-containing protein